jgi:hypothetical protein
LSRAKTKIQISGWAARQGDQPGRIRQERWKALVSSQASYFIVQTAPRLTKCKTMRLGKSHRLVERSFGLSM